MGHLGVIRIHCIRSNTVTSVFPDCFHELGIPLAEFRILLNGIFWNILLLFHDIAHSRNHQFRSWFFLTHFFAWAVTEHIIHGGSDCSEA
jgi:hypothetical protein